MDNFDNFIKEVKKVSSHRHHKISKSYGVYDAYKYYRKNKPKESKYILSESEYFAIIRNINKLLGEEISNGNDITLPEKLGRLEIRKYDSNIKIENGKVKTNLPIDWGRTLKLWYEDEESYKNKTLIKAEEKEIFKVYYNRNLANYNNKSFYMFTLNRELKNKLKNNIKENKIESFYLN